SIYRTLPLFIFDSFEHLRDLPSFPTRRSSDLRRVCTPGNVRSDSSAIALTPPRLKPRMMDRPWPQHPTTTAGVAGKERPGITKRSEEHTSELQSRENLVCRLLLEKKKIEDNED